MPVRPKGRSAKPATRPAKSKVEEVEDDEDEYEEEDDDEEYTPPKSKSSSIKNRARDEDDEDDDEEDLPDVTGGWGKYKKKKAESSSFPNNFALPSTDKGEDPALVVFLEDEPLATYDQHWIEREGKKSFVCVAPEQDCPLCEGGDKVRTMNTFNILRLDEGEPTIYILQAGIKLSDILIARSKKLPLTRGYWSLSKTGKGGSTNYDVVRVKDRDLEEDWPEVEPLDADGIALHAKKKWAAKDAVNRQTRKELLAIAKEMVGDYDRD